MQIFMGLEPPLYSSMGIFSLEKIFKQCLDLHSMYLNYSGVISF